MAHHPQRLNRPTRYEFVVRAELDLRYVAAFDELAVRTEGGRTYLVGEVVDQAQLHGLLDRFRNLGIELISVNPLIDEAEPAS